FRDKDRREGFSMMQNRQYAVKAGDSLNDIWQLEDFERKEYHLRIHGPNGFFREYKGDAEDPLIDIRCEYERKTNSVGRLTGNLVLNISNFSSKVYEMQLINAYQNGKAVSVFVKKGESNHVIKLEKS